MSSVKSLQKREYYGNPQNHFWKLVGALFHEPQSKDYGHKKSVLIRHHIALWDVIDSCSREGSSDSSIRGVKINNFDVFLKQYPNIKAIFCDSLTAFKLFKQFYSHITIPVDLLPSPSPAYTRPFEEKLDGWQKIRKFL